MSPTCRFVTCFLALGAVMNTSCQGEPSLHSNHENGVSGVAYIGRGGTLVSSGLDQLLIIRSPDDAKPLRSFTSAHGWITAVAVTPDGDTLATANSDGSVTLWDTRNWRIVGHLNEHSGPVLSVLFSADGKQLISGGRDGQILIWNVATQSVDITLKEADRPDAPRRLESSTPSMDRSRNG